MPVKKIQKLEDVLTQDQKKILRTVEQSGLSEKETLDLIKIAGRNGLSGKELIQVLQNIDYSAHPTRKRKVPTFTDKVIKIGYFSDAHIGNKMFDEPLWLRMCELFKQQKVQAVYNPGDLLEGMSGRDGHIYELSHIGFENQIKYAAELIRELGLPTYGIDGNHDLWYKGRNNSGIVPGEELEERCDNYHHLGEMEADVEISKGIKMKLYHANDGTAYADSYKIQKLIESFEGGEKPNLVLSGHYHKQVYIFRRNVHGFECGTLCGQTQWMRGKKIPAHKGFGILELYVKPGEIERLRQEFIPGYKN